MAKNTKLFIVIPCYNEQEVLHETADRLEQKIHSLAHRGLISEDSRIMFVNDGSKDDTWSIIEELNRKNSIFCGVSLSRNRGHQNALLAGLFTAAGYEPDAVISIDADLQDDINAIDGMIDAFKEGYDVVYGVRSKRDTDTFFKRFTAEGFYRVMDSLGVETVFNHADYRLLSLRALNGLMQFKEVNLFLRGIVPQIGFKSTSVEYERSERFAGESKYPLKKMLALAWDGITSFSDKPLGLVLACGIGMTFISFCSLIALVVLACCAVSFSDALWIAAAVLFTGGIQLMGTGIVGQYVGKTYKETKARPRYIIDEVLYR